MLQIMATWEKSLSQLRIALVPFTGCELQGWAADGMGLVGLGCQSWVLRHFFVFVCFPPGIQAVSATMWSHLRFSQEKWGRVEDCVLAEFAPLLSIGLSLSAELCRMASSGCKEGREMVTSAGLLFVRKKGKADGCLDHKHWLCTRHCPKPFPCHNSLDPPNNSAMWSLIILL